MFPCSHTLGIDTYRVVPDGAISLKIANQVCTCDTSCVVNINCFVGFTGAFLFDSPSLLNISIVDWISRGTQLLEHCLVVRVTTVNFIAAI
jgi:hypothetical protein